MTYYCKCGGLIALGMAYIDEVTLDQEPYDNGFIEGNMDEVQLNNPLSYAILVCEKCGETYSEDCQNTFDKIPKERKRTKDDVSNVKEVGA